MRHCSCRHLSHPPAQLCRFHFSSSRTQVILMGLYQRRQGVVGSCPYGGFFQSCATGFKGCCLVDACTDGCPAGKDRTEKSAESADTSRGSISSSTENSNPSSTATVDETPSSATAATSSSSSSSSSPSSSSPSSSSPSSSSPSSLSPTATVSWTAEHVITSLSGGPTAHVVIDNQPIPSSTPSNMVAEQPAHGNHALPVAAIVGGSLGGFIALIALASVVCICLKMKKHKIYRSPEYPSPLIGSDMSEQLRGRHPVGVPIALLCTNETSRR